MKCAGWFDSVSSTQSSRLLWRAVLEGPPEGARGRGDATTPLGDNAEARGLSPAAAKTLTEAGRGVPAVRRIPRPITKGRVDNARLRFPKGPDYVSRATLDRYLNEERIEALSCSQTSLGPWFEEEGSDSASLV